MPNNEVISTINLLVAANFKASCGVTCRVSKYLPKTDRVIFYAGERVEHVEPTSGGFIIFAQNAEFDHLEASFYAHGCLVNMMITEVAA